MSALPSGVAKLGHAVVFQVLWLALVLAAGTRWSLAVAAVTLLISILQLRLAKGSLVKGVVFVVLTVFIGTVMDVLITLGGIALPARCLVPFPFSPVWLIGLWVAFAVFMKTVLTYLRGKPLTQFCAGAIGGPLAYWSGARLGAVQLHANTLLAMGALSLAWGCVCVLCFALLKRLDAAPRSGRGSRVVPGRYGLSVVLLSLTCSTAGAATELFEPTLQAGPHLLQQIGVGALRRWTIKGCDIALYAPAGVRKAEILGDIPRCLKLHYVRPIRADQFAEAAWSVLETDLSTSELAAMKGSIDALHALYRDVKKGDTYVLLYVPGEGTTLILNGQPLGTVEGAAFASAYFGVWLGRNPLDKHLRDQLVAGAR